MQQLIFDSTNWDATNVASRVQGCSFYDWLGWFHCNRKAQQNRLKPEKTLTNLTLSGNTNSMCSEGEVATGGVSRVVQGGW